MGRPAIGGNQHVVIPDDHWAELGQLHGSQRNRIVRELIAAYLGKPGAKRPVRPAVADDPQAKRAAS
jgi:hypothetical protein